MLFQSAPTIPSRIVRWRNGLSLILLATLGAAPLAGASSVQIDANFPGGNIVVERMEGDTVFLHQDLRETAGDWFYWCFRVRGAAGRTLQFQFTKSPVIGARGPAHSRDGGRTWQWLGTNIVTGQSFTHHFPADATEDFFSLAMPYTERNWRIFLARVGASPALAVETLCQSPHGRDVELARLGQIHRPPAHRVALTARHHACEMMMNYALEGIIEAVLAEDETGRWLREHVEFLIVPFMDKDGVEEGLQGKNRLPHDPNRDYQGMPHYPSVKALKQRLPAWSERKLRFALDLHCPYIRGAGSERIHFVGSPYPVQWARARRLCDLLARGQTGPLPYYPEDNIPYGKSWNTVAEPKMFGRWAAGLPGVDFATTIELPYATVRGVEVNAATARAFGHDLARAMREYLLTRPTR